MVIDLLKVICSSAVIAAFINLIMQNKSNQITHITSSRAIWRQDIKKYTKKINSCDGKKLLMVLDAIKVNLNGYGCYKKNEYPPDEKLDFLKDEHIWKTIDNIETECTKRKGKDKEFIEREKNKLCLFLDVLLKFDWERSKDEVKKNMMAVFSLVFFCLSVFTCCIQYINYSNGIDLKQLQEGLKYFWLLAFPYLFMWFPYLLEKPKILKEVKWYKNVKIYLYSWIIALFFEVIVYMFISLSDIELGKLIFFHMTALILAMFYPMSMRLSYIEYDSHIMKNLQLNSLVIYPMKEGWNLIRVTSFFGGEGMNYRLDYKSNDFLYDNEFKVYIDSLMKSRKVLRWCWRFDYFLRRKQEGLYNYINAYPERCKCVVRYQKEGSKVKYSVGYQKKLWNQWIDK